MRILLVTIALLALVLVSALLPGRQLKATNPAFNYNLQIVPLIDSSDDQSYRLHKNLYSLLWMKRRIAYGTEKYLRAIPQVTFWMDPHYYAATVESYWIDTLTFPDKKVLNVTINALNVNTDKMGKAEEEAHHGIHHYYYYLQAEYHCQRDPTALPGAICNDTQYFLDVIYVEVYPVGAGDKKNIP